MTDEKLARKAYEAYTGTLGISRSRGYLSWEDLPENRKRAWRAVSAVLTDGNRNDEQEAT